MTDRAASKTEAGPGNPPDRLHLLTFARFAAAFWVLVFHLQYRLSLALPWPFLSIVSNGAYAMSFFFVLSGAVLAYGYFTLAPSNDATMRFYVARCARIYPAYAVIHLIALPWLGIPFPAEWPRWVFTNATTVLGVQAWFPHAFLGANAGTWSISCEFFFYAVFPLLLPAARYFAQPGRCARAVLYVCLLIGFLGLADFAFGGGSFPIYYISPMVRLPEFFLGMLIGVALRQMPARRVSGWMVFAAAGAVLLASTNTIHRTALWTRANCFVVPAIALLIYCSAAYELAHRQVVSGGLWRVPRYLGEVSYCYFLVQLPLLGWFDVAAVSGHAIVHWSRGAPLTATGLAVLLVLAGSILLHEFVEKPVRRAILRRWFARPATPSAMPAP